MIMELDTIITVVGTINGSINYSLSTQYSKVTIIYNGVDWNIV